MIIDDFARRWGYKGSGGDAPAEVDRLEELIGVPLPKPYREFLLRYGGGYIEAYSICRKPSPIATCSVTVLHSAAEVIDLLDSEVTPRNMVCISYGHDGQTGCLSIAGLDHGQVFALDTKMRVLTWDTEALTRMPNLNPDIREFFRLRDADELPEKPWGYENCYLLADSFGDFLTSLRPPVESDD